MIHTIARFVRHHDVVDHLRVGWCPSAALEGTHHSEHSVLVVWMCACPVAVPIAESLAEEVAP
jgi:hypothetical protein